MSGLNLIKNLKVKDIAWLAGLLEGEGSFNYSNGTPRISITMTAKDTIERASKLMGISKVAVLPRANKDAYVINCYGQTAVIWMVALFNLMGKENRDKIESVLLKTKYTLIKGDLKID